MCDLNDDWQADGCVSACVMNITEVQCALHGRHLHDGGRSAAEIPNGCWQHRSSRVRTLTSGEMHVLLASVDDNDMHWHTDARDVRRRMVESPTRTELDVLAAWSADHADMTFGKSSVAAPSIVPGAQTIYCRAGLPAAASSLEAAADLMRQTPRLPQWHSTNPCCMRWWHMGAEHVQPGYALSELSRQTDNPHVYTILPDVDLTEMRLDAGHAAFKSRVATVGGAVYLCRSW